MRRAAIILAVLTLISLTVVFALLGTGGGGPSRSSAVPNNGTGAASGGSGAPGRPQNSSRRAKNNSRPANNGSGAPDTPPRSSGAAAGTSGSPSESPNGSGGSSGSAAPTQISGTSTFTTGIADSVYYQPQAGKAWLGRTIASGAQFILLPVSWATVAPQPPPAGTNPSDPDNPGYKWGSLDTTVRAAESRGLRVVLSLTNAPPWADGPGRPANAAPGTWRPNVTAAAAFVEAVARRYSGSFNSGSGRLPRVRYFQAWTEPNLPNHLTPQWVRAGRHWVAESPIIYRSLLNATYRVVKAVHPSNLVITAGTAPYGDPPGGERMRPVLFWEDVLCLTGRLTPARCPNPAHFDILAHDSYSFAGPLRRAYWANDVTLPDMWKLTRIVAAAERTGRALPRIHHPVWVTEFGWNSRPPTRHGVPVRARARWIDEAFYELWQQGISTATWNLIVDQRPRAGMATWQSGLYYDDGRRKPDLQAFRFPFVAEPASKGSAEVWGVSPQAGMVRVEERQSGRWTTALRVRVPAHGVIDRTIAVSGHPMLRAVVGSDASLGWRP